MRTEKSLPQFFNYKANELILQKKLDNSKLVNPKEDGFDGLLFINADKDAKLKEPTEEELNEELNKLLKDNQLKINPPDVEKFAKIHIEFLESMQKEVKKELSGDIAKKEKETLETRLEVIKKSIETTKELVKLTKDKDHEEISKIFKEKSDKLYKELNKTENEIIKLTDSNQIQEEFKKVRKLRLGILIQSHSFYEQFIQTTKTYNKSLKILRLIAEHNLKSESKDTFNDILPYRKKIMESDDNKKIKEYNDLVGLIQKRAQMSFAEGLELGKDFCKFKGEAKLNSTFKFLVSSLIAEAFHNRSDLVEHALTNPKQKNPLKIVVSDSFPKDDKTILVTMGGFYHPPSNTMVIRKSFLLSELSSGETFASIHEFVHALDVDEKGLCDGILYGMTDEQKKELKVLITNILGFKKLQFSDKEEEREKYQKIEEAIGLYGLSKESEFIAEVIPRILRHPEKFQDIKELKELYNLLKKYLKIDPLNDLKEKPLKEEQVYLPRELAKAA